MKTERIRARSYRAARRGIRRRARKQGKVADNIRGEAITLKDEEGMRTWEMTYLERERKERILRKREKKGMRTWEMDYLERERKKR